MVFFRKKLVILLVLPLLITMHIFAGGDLHLPWHEDFTDEKILVRKLMQNVNPVKKMIIRSFIKKKQRVIINQEAIDQLGTDFFNDVQASQINLLCNLGLFLSCYVQENQECEYQINLYLENNTPGEVIMLSEQYLLFSKSGECLFLPDNSFYRSIENLFG